ncbi:TIGR03089 family protein [Marmoricola sp. RAF53]|uniref:TIGR03089 family protein n=1 Tax=Marmoricola sp. RAF53 TaxID=3233059 RepID=UPI003F9CAD2A
MTTFPDLLARRLRTDPAQPFVTFYDDATGERTELSVTTYANWVSKTANLLADELMLDPGDGVRIDLPPHWLGAVFLGATLSCGLVRDEEAEVAVVGPDGIAAALDRGTGTVLACALLPFATRFRDPLPAGVLDHGILWAGQSDVFSPVGPTDLGAPAADDRRVVTDLDPFADGGALLLGLLAGSGSLVLVVNSADEQRNSGWPAHSQSERATAAVRANQPI